VTDDFIRLSVGIEKIDDIIPGWDLYPWWPLGDQSVRWDNAWPFFSWQNLSTFGLLLAATLLIVLKPGRTPLEWLMPKLDRQLVLLLRRPYFGGSPAPFLRLLRKLLLSLPGAGTTRHHGR
jgi:hypothetical protein